MNQKIKNKYYRQFLDEGIIQILDVDTIKKVLDNIKGRNIKAGRSLIIFAYYSGARPVEYLNIRAMDVTKKGSYVLVKVKGSKNGLPRTIHLPYRLELVKEFYKYAIKVFDTLFIFNCFRTEYKRIRETPKGIKEYVEITDGLRYHFKKWFSDVFEISPYYLRHNRFSSLSQKGATLREIQFQKGAKTTASVESYLHMSSDIAKKNARKLE